MSYRRGFGVLVLLCFHIILSTLLHFGAHSGALLAPSFFLGSPAAASPMSISGSSPTHAEKPAPRTLASLKAEFELAVAAKKKAKAAAAKKAKQAAAGPKPKKVKVAGAGGKGGPPKVKGEKKSKKAKEGAKLVERGFV